MNSGIWMKRDHDRVGQYLCGMVWKGGTAEGRARSAGDVLDPFLYLSSEAGRKQPAKDKNGRLFSSSRFPADNAFTLSAVRIVVPIRDLRG